MRLFNLLAKFLPLAAVIALMTVGACSTQGNITPAQVVSDVNDGLDKLLLVDRALAASVPPVLAPDVAAKLAGQIMAAQAAMGLVGPTVTQAAAITSIEQGEEAINAALNVLVGLPLPAPYSLYVVAASVILPVVEQYVASVTSKPASRVAAARATRFAPGLTVEQARAVLAAK